MSAQHTPWLRSFRHIDRTEWLYAWHYARYDRRNGQISAFVGPTLRAAARDVMHQRRDPLAVRQSMRKLCSPLGAVLATHTEFRAAIAKAGGAS